MSTQRTRTKRRSRDAPTYEIDGYPLWQTKASIGRSPRYHDTRRLKGFSQGQNYTEPETKTVEIGDVGLLDEEGGFVFLFSIFGDPKETRKFLRRRYLPEGFVPMKKELMAEDLIGQDLTSLESTPGGAVGCRKRQGAAGVVVSPGVRIVQLNLESWMKERILHVKSKAKDGAILVLPEGGVQRDLRQTDEFKSYIKENSPSWYDYANKNEELAPVANGKLFIVTGHDKAPSWAMAAFKASKVDQKGRKQDSVEIIFSPDSRHGHWVSVGAEVQTKNGTAVGRRSRMLPSDCVVVRGLHIDMNGDVVVAEAPKHGAWWTVVDRVKDWLGL